MKRDEERKQLKEAFDVCIKSFKASPHDFSTNLRIATRLLVTDWQMKHFYAWLANPAGYTETAVNSLEVMGDKVPKIEPYEDHMEICEYPNGDEMFLHIKNPKFYKKVEEEKYDSEEDEKRDSEDEEKFLCTI